MGSSCALVLGVLGFALGLLGLALELDLGPGHRDAPSTADPQATASPASLARSPSPSAQGRARAPRATGSAAPRRAGVRAQVALPLALPDWALEALGQPGERSGLRSNLQPLAGGAGLRAADLAVLAEIIHHSGLDEASSPFDYDDGDGRFEPWELGYQVWRHGRLVLLSTGPSPRFSFGYALDSLPASLGDLAYLEVLDLHGSALHSLPETLGELRALRELRLDQNRLAALPRSISDLAALRRLNLGRNRLTVLPGELGSLVSLEDLAAGDNPLERIEGGALDTPNLKRLGVERTTARDADEEAGSLEALPEQIAQLPLEELRVGGNRLFCGAGAPPFYLVDGSIPSVVGLGAQDCGSP